MFEVLAMFFLVAWVAGLVSGNALGGLIHIFLVAALVSLFVHHRVASRARSAAQALSARDMAHVMGKPTAPSKSRPGRGSRSSAAA